ncbi:glycoside hydrolase family 3 protein [Leucobacter sp. NPDC058333]|uniref:glycoside hydrolase family 3 protein n=1 Tax=Leucobacter sp. NPDC058333 TaxID=3346450 RepID=UPI00366A45FF
MSELRRAIRATLMPGFTGLEAPEWVFAAIEQGVRSFCIYGDNVQDRTQLTQLGAALRAANPELILAIDEEGGEVTRLHYREGSPYPSAAVLGRIDDPAYTERVGARVARSLLGVGFDLALGPVADVNSDPRNPVIGTRSFGADPELVSRHVAAWVRGVQRAGATACAKHFPGHGATTLDSHLDLPIVADTAAVIAQRDLPPFAAAIDEGVGAIMTSHILLPEIDPNQPATFSPTILQGMLREQFGFAGVIVSDALDMSGATNGIDIPEAVVRALAAGCDLLCLGIGSSPELLRDIEERVITAIASGRLSEARVFEAEANTAALAAARPLLGTALTEADPSSPTHTETERIAASFSGSDAARAWIAAHPEAAVLRVESESNQAVGNTPWGPFAPAAARLSGSRGACATFSPSYTASVSVDSPRPWRVRADAAAEAEEISDAGCVIIGRDLHRHAFARAGIDALRKAGRDLLVVEMGWPGPAEYADVATFGSTALVGSALLTLIEEDPS